MDSVKEVLNRHFERQQSVKEVLNRHIECPQERVPEVGVLRRASFVPTVRAVSEEKRQITFVASDETVDRYGDILRVTGWDTRNYLRNPVFLWAHRSTEPPIGKTIELRIESNPPALVQVVQFANKESYPFADQIFQLYRGGFLRSVSVGFKPTAPPKPIRDPQSDQITGFEFTKQELIELSAVPLPANPNAVARAIGEGVITPSEAGKFFRSADEDDRLRIEVALARISLERINLTVLELQCKNLLVHLGPSEPVDTEIIKDLAQLESALRGEAN